METRLTAKEVRKLRKEDILEILVQVIRENESLRSNLKEAKRLLQNRLIAKNGADSLSDACMKLNEVFEAEKEACAHYEKCIKTIEEETKAECKERVRQMETDILAVLFQVQKEAETKIQDAEKIAKKIIADALSSTEITERKAEQNKQELSA